MSIWGIGVARGPKPPSSSPPKESKYKCQQQHELEALRQRGLAKLLNKHFTSVTVMIAAERAAADAAIRDLEERRKLHKDFVSNPGELSVWDAMYMELQQKKADCKRKEKETLLLYQRYVNKFGNTGAIAVPTKYEVGNALNRPIGSSSDLLTSQMVVGRMAEDIEATLKTLVSKGADRHPSIKNLGVEETLQNRQHKAAYEDSLISKKLLESRGIDVKAASSTDVSKLTRAEAFRTATAAALVTPTKSEIARKSTDTSNLSLPTTTATDAEVDSDDRSVVSGLTSVNSHVISDAELQLLTFLRTETEAIRQMIDQEELNSVRSGKTSYSIDVRSQSARAAKKAEEMVQQMNEMLKEFQEKKIEPSKINPDYPYRFITSNSDENWLVYYDDDHEREYFHETISNVVQWKKPGAISGESVRSAQPTDADYMPMSDFTPKEKRLPSHAEFTPERLALTRNGSLSRRDLYRRKQRKRRKQRRLAAAVFILVTACGGGYAVHRYDNDASFAARVNNVLAHESTQRVIVQYNRFVDKAISIVPDPITRQIRHTYKKVMFYLPDMFTGESHRRTKEAEETEMKRSAAKVEAERAKAAQAERAAAELKVKEKKAKDALIRKEKKDADRKAKESIKKAREGAAAAAQRLAEEAEEQRKEEEAARIAAEEMARRALHRPWACNIPLAYIIHPRCRRLSKANPVFNLKELVDAMMQ
jgi:putative transposon-encoded protein